MVGLVHIYTGDGKGKTSAAIGLAIRASGHDLKIKVIQFLKGGNYTGEYLAIKNYLKNIKIKQFGKSCIKSGRQLKIIEKEPDIIKRTIDCGSCRYCFMTDDEEKISVKDAFNYAKNLINSNKFNIVILDEINSALSKNLLNLDDVIKLIKNKPKETELILTGRNAPEELVEIADLVTEMKEIKHPYKNGILGREGIEY